MNGAHYIGNGDPLPISHREYEILCKNADEIRSSSSSDMRVLQFDDLEVIVGKNKCYNFCNCYLIIEGWVKLQKYDAFETFEMLNFTTN